MITVNMHDAKTRLSQLVKAVEENHEVVLLCRNGRAVAEIRAFSPASRPERFHSDPSLKPIAIRYDPTEPLAEDEWPSKYR